MLARDNFPFNVLPSYSLSSFSSDIILNLPPDLSTTRTPFIAGTLLLAFLLLVFLLLVVILTGTAVFSLLADAFDLLADAFDLLADAFCLLDVFGLLDVFERICFGA